MLKPDRARCRMTPKQFAAIAELTGITDTGKTREALYSHYVGGLSQSAAARKAGISPMTVNNAMRKIELTQARLPALAETVRCALGE